MLSSIVRDSRTRFLLALGGWSAVLLAALRSPLGQRALVAPFTAWHAAFASGFAGGSPVTVDLSCSGSDVIAISMAALLAYPAPWRRRLSGVALAVVVLCCLNIVRIITLVETAGSPLFAPLHAYIWPGVMIGSSAALVAGWILWMRRQVPGSVDEHARVRRLVALAAVLIVAYVAVTPWLLASLTLQRAAMRLAQWAASLLAFVGLPALTGGSTLVVGGQAFLVTPECVITPLMPVYLAWFAVWPREWRTRAMALAAFVPLFGALGFVRLLTVALPALIGPPLFLTHGFYQFLVAALLLAGAAFWGSRRIEPAGGRPAHALGTALVTAIALGIAIGNPYTRLIERVAAAVSPAPRHTLALGDAPELDVQGALAIMPAFELSLLCGLAVALWGRRALRPLVVLIPIGALLQVATLVISTNLAVRFAAEVPVTFVRAASLLTPCLLVAAATAARPRAAARTLAASRA